MAFPHDSSLSAPGASWDEAVRGWSRYPCRSWTRLNGRWNQLLNELSGVGEVRCITANEVARHERVGVFGEVEFYGNIGIALGEEIDLRLFLEHWRYGAALEEEAPEGLRRSLVFADKEGCPVLRVESVGDAAAFEALVNRYALEEGAEASDPVITPFQPLSDEEVDVAAFRQAWLALEDTAAFAEMLRSFGVRREQGLRLAPEGYTRRVQPDSCRAVLESARQTGLRMMILGSTPGCIQIHTGTLENLVDEGDALVITEDRFSFRLKLPEIGSAWVVRKPTIDGVISSLELFDRNGRNVALFFGKRASGQPEDDRWRTILSHLHLS